MSTSAASATGASTSNTPVTIRALKPTFHLTDSTAIRRPAQPAAPAASSDVAKLRNKRVRPRHVEATPKAAIPASADLLPAGFADEDDAAKARLAVGADKHKLAKAKDTDQRSHRAYKRERKLDRQRQALINTAKEKAKARLVTPADPDAMDVDGEQPSDPMDVDVTVDEAGIWSSVRPFSEGRPRHPVVDAVTVWVDELARDMAARTTAIDEEISQMRAQGTSSAKTVRKRTAELFAQLYAARKSALDRFAVLALDYHPVEVIADEVKLELE